MTKAKPRPPVDTTAGTTAYLLATTYKAELDPRLPAGTRVNLATDLTTLGAVLTEAPAAHPGEPNGEAHGGPATPEATPPTPAPPSLTEAMATAVTLITAVRAAMHRAGAKTSVRKAYGVARTTLPKEAKAVVAEGGKIVARVHSNPSEALSLGILPEDATALATALTELTAAEAAAKGGTGDAVKAKQVDAAEKRMKEAVARIAGAGVLAFARNAELRAKFAALVLEAKSTKGKKG